MQVAHFFCKYTKGIKLSELITLKSEKRQYLQHYQSDKDKAFLLESDSKLRRQSF